MEIVKRIVSCFNRAWRPALKTAGWLLKIMIPVSLLMALLQYFGLLSVVSKSIAPLFSALGLPPEAAFAYLSGYFMSVYASISAMGFLTLTARQITILGIMVLISHNMIVETSVQKKTGSKAWRMVLLRTLSAFAVAYVLNLLLPADNVPVITGGQKLAAATGIVQVLQTWGIDTLHLVLKVVVLVTALMFLQRLLEEFGFNTWLARIFAPVMQLMGLPREVSFLWIIANTLGLAYGSAVLIEQVDNKTIKRSSADLLNHHIALSHSLLEDSLLLIAVGAMAPWIIFPRLAIGIIVVWLCRLELVLLSPASVFRKN